MDTAEGAPVLAVAAEAREFAGLLRHASSLTRLDWPVRYACQVRLGAERWVLVANGPGPNLARRAARAAYSRVRPRLTLSTGLCGALDPALRTGDLFIATKIRVEEREFGAFGAKNRRHAATGVVWSCDRVAVSSAEKRAIRARGADVVEMEAASVAKEAEREETPFYCVRVISDEAQQDLPLDFNRYRDKEGRFSRPRIAAAVAMRPWLIGRLGAFDAACRRAAWALGDFLADCQF